MPVSRQDAHKYLNDLTRFYTCLTKIGYVSRLPATKAAYALESIRLGRFYTVYSCPFCPYYHVGRQKKSMEQGIIKRDDWRWLFTVISPDRAKELAEE